MPPARVPLEVRFASCFTEGEPDECWEWEGGCYPNGYGRISEGGRNSRRLMAHRVAYELAVGPIPEGLVIDHLCRNVACVNPAHLEPVTNRENTVRGLIGMRELCRHGHPLDGLTAAGRGRLPKRVCLTCRRARQKARRETGRPATRAS